MNIKQLILNEKVEFVYQPLWDIRQLSIYGYESLLRISHDEMLNIEEIFIIAREQGLLYDLDTLAIEGTIKKFPFKLFDNELLFVNIFPSTLIHQKFASFLTSLILNYPEIQGRIVFELNETVKEVQLWDFPMLKERMKLLRNYQFLIALDDVGKGECDLEKTSKFLPDYIKIDRYFSEGLSVSTEKQQFISKVVHFCEEKNIGIVLEGIEEESDLAIAKFLNIPFVQGYLLGKPEKIKYNNAMVEVGESFIRI